MPRLPLTRAAWTAGSRWSPAPVPGSLTQTTAYDVAGANIYVNAIACGGVMTPPFRAYLDAATEAQRLSLLQMVPAGRLGEPEEYAALAVFLAAQDHYLVGQVISPSGGVVI